MLFQRAIRDNDIITGIVCIGGRCAWRNRSDKIELRLYSDRPIELVARNRRICLSRPGKCSTIIFN